MTRSVDRIDVRNVKATGQAARVDRYTFELEIWYTDDAGKRQHVERQVCRWPDDLAGLPLEVIQAWAVDHIIDAKRRQHGIDTVSAREMPVVGR